MRRKKEQKANHERWLVSYADFVTMIFALFVVLFASARRDTARQADMASAIAAAFTQLGLFAPHSTTPPLTKQLAASNKVISLAAANNSDFVGTPQQRTDLLALKKRLQGELASEIQAQTVAGPRRSRSTSIWLAPFVPTAISS